jgi:hypothetical protein
MKARKRRNPGPVGLAQVHRLPSFLWRLAQRRGRRPRRGQLSQRRDLQKSELHWTRVKGADDGGHENLPVGGH